MSEERACPDLLNYCITALLAVSIYAEADLHRSDLPLLGHAGRLCLLLRLPGAVERQHQTTLFANDSIKPPPPALCTSHSCEAALFGASASTGLPLVVDPPPGTGLQRIASLKVSVRGAAS